MPSHSSDMMVNGLVTFQNLSMHSYMYVMTLATHFYITLLWPALLGTLTQ